MADDIRSRAGLDPRQEAARRLREGEARRAAARSALTEEQMRERVMREMEARRAAPPAPAAEPAMRPANPRPNVAQRMPSPATVARVGSRAIPGVGTVRSMAPTSLQAGADFEREGLRRARAEDMAQRRAAEEQSMGEAGQRMPTPRPAPARRAAAPAAREISADRLNDLMMGAEPATPEERVAQMRMRQRQQELEERGTAFRKGGMVKPKAMKVGGKVAAPKKMMKGGAVAKPKSKPMPAFKRGGMIKKGKK